MKNIFYVLCLLLATNTTNAAATTTHEHLLAKNLILTTTDFAGVIQKTENNIRLFVDYYQVRLDKGAKITSPKEVSGTQLQPVLKVGIKKCVFIVCEKINVDIEFTLHKVNGPCHLNYELTGDMQRSSIALADTYSHLNTSMCLNQTPSGAQTQLVVNLVRSSKYKKGNVQKEILQFFRLQADSIVESFTAVMKANGVSAVQ